MKIIVTIVIYEGSTPKGTVFVRKLRFAFAFADLYRYSSDFEIVQYFCFFFELSSPPELFLAVGFFEKGPV